MAVDIPLLGVRSGYLSTPGSLGLVLPGVIERSRWSIRGGYSVSGTRWTIEKIRLFVIDFDLNFADYPEEVFLLGVRRSFSPSDLHLGVFLRQGGALGVGVPVLC